MRTNISFFEQFNQTQQPKLAGKLVSTLAGLVLLATAASCSLFDQPVTLTVKAGINPSPAASERTISSGTTVETITSYKVIFKKIEVGNSEYDKFTLWESRTGELKDLVTEFTFTDIREVKEGSYKFVRLTLGDSLEVAGSITDPDTSIVHTGSGTFALTAPTYLWGTEVTNGDGSVTLTAPVQVKAGGTMKIGFGVAGTVTFLSGSGSSVSFNVVKPALTLSIQ